MKGSLPGGAPQAFWEGEIMTPSAAGRRVGLLLLLGFLLGCAVPSSASPPLTAAAAQSLLDGWNPGYCKVVEFYGFYTPGERANSRDEQCAYHPTERSRNRGVTNIY